MNPFTLTTTIAKSIYLLNKRTVAFGEPVHWTNEEASNFLNTLPQNPLMNNRFALASNIKLAKVFYQFNVDEYLGIDSTLSVEGYFRLIHLDYLEDYLKWGEIVYQHAQEQRHALEPMQQCFRISFPMKLKNKQYYWVLMEAYPLQLDAENNMISHLNIYTVLNRFIANEKIPLVGDMWSGHQQQTDWTHDIWKKYTTKKTFILTPAQSEIVNLLSNNLELTHAELATLLGKSKNTIDIQNKQILARARETFGNQYFTTVKDVVKFLKEMQFFQEQLFKSDS